MEAIMMIFANLWNRWRKRRAQVRELDRMDRTELDRVSHELGMSATELRRVLGFGDHAADLLLRRMQNLYLDPRKVDPAVMRDLQRSCACCRAKTLCAHELEDRPKGATWPKYCPNELTLGALSADNQQRAT
jgi:hypothetical protein